MSFEQIAAIIGAITGLISIAGVIYAYGYKFGQLKELQGKMIDPVEYGKLCTQVQTLYAIYVLGALQKKENPKSNPGSNNPGNKEHKLSKEALDTIHKLTIDCSNMDDLDIVVKVVEELGASRPQELIGLIKELQLTPFLNKVYEQVSLARKEALHVTEDK
jgi:hypothetical protein